MNAARDWSPIPEVLWPILDRVFDSEWYLATNPDLRGRRGKAAEHFRKFGFAEGRSPTVLFDATYYRATSPAAFPTGLPPFEHFIVAPANERGNPNPLFDCAWIDLMCGNSGHPLLAYLDDAMLDPSPLFDSTLVPAGSTTPLETYLKSDAREIPAPCPLFDSGFYISSHPDVDRPLEHYVMTGGFAGAAPAGDLDAHAYVQRSPWVLAGLEPPLLHFLKHGVNERTAWNPLGTQVLVRDLIAAGRTDAAAFLMRRWRESLEGRRFSSVVRRFDDLTPGTTFDASRVAPGIVVPDRESSPVCVSPDAKHEFAAGHVGRIGVAVFPHTADTIVDEARLVVAASELDLVLDAQHARQSTIVARDVVPTGWPMPPEVRMLDEDEWVCCSARLEIASPATRRPIREAQSAAAQLHGYLRFRLTSVPRFGSDAVWPVPAEALTAIAQCSLLDVDGDIPTSALLLAPSCSSVVVRTDRAFDVERWQEACHAAGVEMECARHSGGRAGATPPPSLGAAIPSRNHGQWVTKAVESMLDLEPPLSEVVVVDDGSTDDTAEAIASIGDPRLRMLRTDHVGPGAALNVGIASMTSDLVAFLGSDDYAFSNRSSHDLELLADPSISAIASLPVIVDEGGAELPDGAAAFLFPRDDPRDPRDVLRVLWRDGNFICHPAVTMRREAYWQCGASPPGLLHLHDFLLWVRLAGRGLLACSSERTTAYRRSRTASSLSSPNGNRRLREELEWSFDRFFDTCLPSVFGEVFGAHIAESRRAAPDPGLDSIPLYLDSQFDFVRRRGLQKALSAFENPESRAILAECYGLDEQRLFALGEEIDIDGLETADRPFNSLRLRSPWRMENVSW